MRKAIRLLAGAAVLAAMIQAGCRGPSSEEKRRMEAQVPEPRKFPGLEPGMEPPGTQTGRGGAYSTKAESAGVIKKIALEIEQLKPEHAELSDFPGNCVSADGLAIHYSKNVVERAGGTTALGEGQACEIVVRFSQIENHPQSSTRWEYYTITYPKLNWQVSSYPACFWMKDDPDAPPAGDARAQFGGPFVRSHSLPLCKAVHEIVVRNLKPIRDMEDATRKK